MSHELEKLPLKKLATGFHAASLKTTIHSVYGKDLMHDTVVLLHLSSHTEGKCTRRGTIQTSTVISTLSKCLNDKLNMTWKMVFNCSSSQLNSLVSILLVPGFPFLILHYPGLSFHSVRITTVMSSSDMIHSASNSGKILELRPIAQFHRHILQCRLHLLEKAAA